VRSEVACAASIPFLFRQALLALKRQASASKGQDRLRQALPGVDALFARWVEAGRNVGTLTAATLRLLDSYGPELLSLALVDVLARGTHDPGALAADCEQRRRAKGQPPPLELHFGSHVPDRDVTPHCLERYDELNPRLALRWQSESERRGWTGRNGSSGHSTSTSSRAGGVEAGLRVLAVLKGASGPRHPAAAGAAGRAAVGL
jgi:hypothetical protein